MAKRDPDRLNKLLTQLRLRERAVVLVGRWASQGVFISPVAHDRYWLLLDRLRRGRSGPMRKSNDLNNEIAAFIAGYDILTILGWNVDEEPALLVSAERLMAKISVLNHIYPDGFVLISDAAGKALLVDFDDEEGIQTGVVELPAPGF